MKKTKQELLVWAEESGLVPESDVALDVRGTQPGDQFAVALAEDRENDRSPGERYSVSTARMTLLEGRAKPLRGEPFTEFFSRRRFAEQRMQVIGDELNCSSTR